MYKGWYQVGFERELEGDLSLAWIGGLPLVLVRESDGVRAFDAVCPHRGANLALGGRLDGGVIVCPFHGHRIALGNAAACSYAVAGYTTLALGGLIFVLLDDAHDHGFAAMMAELDRSHYLVPGFSLEAKVRPELVVENGFDRAHFAAVHGLEAAPDLQLGESRNGELVVEGSFAAPSAVGWMRDGTGAARDRFGFAAHVFSPTLCVTRLGEGAGSYLVISAATPAAAGRCTIRVSLAVPPSADGSTPDAASLRALLRDSRLAYEQDMAIWENLCADASPQYAPEDDLVLAFHRFCRRFESAPSP